MYQNVEKLYQITRKYTKCQQNIPIGRKIDRMTIKCTNIFYCKTLQNLPKVGNLGLKIYHLATLLQNNTFSFENKSKMQLKASAHFFPASCFCKLCIILTFGMESIIKYIIHWFNRWCYFLKDTFHDFL
jgi:hypothetical protein